MSGKYLTAISTPRKEMHYYEFLVSKKDNSLNIITGRFLRNWYGHSFFVEKIFRP